MSVHSGPLGLPARYRLDGLIATGGMASVYAAHDTVLDRPVAVKVLAEHLTEDPDARRRFEREARAAAALSSHPAVVTIYDVGEHEGRSFIVMERRMGGTVADELARGPLDRKRALRWLSDVADALDAAHARGVVHRDIKPGNLLLDEHDRVAIADFGIAHLAHEREKVTQTGQIVGTGAYLAPEQAAGEAAVPASDRYALAVVAYELLAGDQPFKGSGFAAQIRAHAEDPPPDAPGLPRAAQDVLKTGLAKTAGERWQSCGRFVAALTAALEDSTATTRVAGPTWQRDAGAAGAGAAAGAAASDALGGNGAGATGAGGTGAGATGAGGTGAGATGAGGTSAGGTGAGGTSAGGTGGGASGGVGAGGPAGGRGGRAGFEGRAAGRRDEPVGPRTEPMAVVGAGNGTTSGGHDTPPPPPRGGPDRRLIAVLCAILGLALIGGAIAATTGDDDPSTTASDKPAAADNKRKKARKTPTATATETAAPVETATAAPTDTPEPTATETPSETVPTGDPGSLNDRGYALLQSGDANAAVPFLERAVDGCASSTDLDPCGYAYYNLGVAYTAAGRPAEAIPILQTRLERWGYDRRGTVKKALKDACKAAGQDC